VGEQLLDLSEFVVAAIACQQPGTRDGLRDIFGKDIRCDLTGRFGRRLITPGPRPCTFVTIEQFLAAFGLQSLYDPPDCEQPENVDIVTMAS